MHANWRSDFPMRDCNGWLGGLHKLGCRYADLLVCQASLFGKAARLLLRAYINPLWMISMSTNRMFFNFIGD